MAAPCKLAAQWAELLMWALNWASADTLQVCEQKRAPLSGIAPTYASEDTPNAYGQGTSEGTSQQAPRSVEQAQRTQACTNSWAHTRNHHHTHTLQVEGHRPHSLLAR